VEFAICEFHFANRKTTNMGEPGYLAKNNKNSDSESEWDARHLHDNAGSPEDPYCLGERYLDRFIYDWPVMLVVFLS
jgi:hypothetical protein